MDRPVVEDLTLELKDGVGVISLDRPHYLNVLDLKTLGELDSTLRYVGGDTSIKAVVLRSSAEKVFTAGADIKVMRDLNEDGARAFASIGQGIARRIERLDQPVIVALRGMTMGGGVEIACACDIRIAAEGTMLAQPEIDIGVIPGWGGTQRLVRHVGPGMAKYIILSGKRIDAEDARRIGLVDFVVPAGDLDRAATDMARLLASKSRPALFAAKKAINRAIENGLEAGLHYETELWDGLFSTHDQKEGMRAFLEKRKPEFTDS